MIVLEVNSSNVVDLAIEDSDYIPMDGTDITKVPASMDYEKLYNKPQLNGKTISGNMSEIDPTVHDWAKAMTRPVYTAEEVGAVDLDDLGGIDIKTLSDLWDSI